MRWALSPLRLRVSETLALQPKVVDLEDGIVRVLHGKGDRHRAVGLEPGAAAVVAAWLAESGRAQRVAARANPHKAGQGTAHAISWRPRRCAVPSNDGTLEGDVGYVADLVKRAVAHGHVVQLVIDRGTPNRGTVTWAYTSPPQQREVGLYSLYLHDQGELFVVPSLPALEGEHKRFALRRSVPTRLG